MVLLLLFQCFSTTLNFVHLNLRLWNELLVKNIYRKLDCQAWWKSNVEHSKRRLEFDNQIMPFKIEWFYFKGSEV